MTKPNTLSTIAAVSPPEPQDRHWPWLIGVLALTAISSAARVDNALVWDDAQLVQLAQDQLRRGDVLASLGRSMLAQVHENAASARELDLYRPVGLLSFVVMEALGGQVLLQHALNLSLHLACVALVFGFARQAMLERQPWLCALPAAWLGVSPHLAEAHVWISGRFDLLATFFALCALWFLRRAWSRAGARAASSHVLCALCCLLSLLSKETLFFALPALVLLPEQAGLPRLARLRHLAPCAVAAIVYLLLRFQALGSGGAGLDWDDALLALSRWPIACVDGAIHLLFPGRIYPRLLKEDYAALPVWAWAAALGACVMLALAAFRRRRELPLLACSLSWFALALAPAAVISTQSWPGFGRFLYLPSTLFFVAVAQSVAVLAQRLPRLLGLLRAGSILHVLTLALLLSSYTRAFASDAALFSSIVEIAPERSHGHAFLGMTLLEQRRQAEAAVLLQTAHAIAPDDRRYAQQLGSALLFSGQRDAALAHARACIERFERPAEFRLLAAYALLERDPARAAELVLSCLTDAPDNRECRDALTFLQRSHPRAAEYRALFSELVLTARFAALRQLVHDSRDAQASPPASAE